MSLGDLWFGIFVAVIAGYVILDGFDIGVGSLHLVVAKTDEERRRSLNSIGPVWDGNEVWIVLGVGVLFAAFPAVYASLFSGFYVVFMLVLLVMILRTVAIEFRSKRPGTAWRRAWDGVFSSHSLALGLSVRGLVREHRRRGNDGESGNIHAYSADLLTPYTAARRSHGDSDVRHPRLALPRHEDNRRIEPAGPRLAPKMAALRFRTVGPHRDVSGPGVHSLPAGGALHVVSLATWSSPRGALVSSSRSCGAIREAASRAATSSGSGHRP